MAVMSSDDGKRRRRKLSDDEHTLWGRVTRSVMPLRRKPVLLDLEVVAATPAGQAKSAAHARARSKAPPKLAPVPPPKHTPKPVLQAEPLDRRQKRRLARGTEPIDARIDLHGRTQNEAHAALLGFLRAAQRDGAKFVLVITGKGLRGDDHRSERGVLKRQVPLWLQLPEFRSYVVGFEQAHIGHGGEGALYVRLRRSSKHA
jgi:DNA-nicking Smr family endonuclease